MRVGFARRLITPEPGVWMAGYAFRDHPAEGVADDLFVHALALEDDAGRRVVLVTADLIGFHPTITNAVREEVRKHRPAIRPSEILFNATHTHCGPIVHQDRLYISPERYSKRTVDRIIAETVTAIREALIEPVPCRIGLHTGRHSIGINRRKRIGDRIQMAPNPEGFVDRELVVLRIDRSRGAPILFFTMACHPTTLNWYRFSADYPGFARRALERTLGEGAIAIFAQGACGDVRPNCVDPETGRFRAGTYEEAEAFGETLARDVLAALDVEDARLDLDLASVLTTVALPLGEPMSREALERMAAESSNEYHRLWAEFQLCIPKPKRSVDVFIHWIRLAPEAQIIGVGGEVCGGLGDATKRLFPNTTTLFLGYTEDVIGYIPTREILEEGGYEGYDSFFYSDFPAPYALVMPEVLLNALRELPTRQP